MLPASSKSRRLHQTLGDIRRPSSVRWTLLATLVLATCVSVAWFLRLPLFAEPDEQAHLDYALFLARGGWPIATQGRRSGTDVDALLTYLERRTTYRQLRFDSSAPLPTGYGSSAWVKNVDAAAPADRTQFEDKRERRFIPYVANSYPPGFYLAAATMYWSTNRFFHTGAFESVTCMRTLGLFALPLTLFAAYAVFRCRRVDRYAAVFATAAIGVFPLTSWLSGTFQPDTWTAMLVGLALLSATVCRRSGDIRGYIAFGSIMGALAFVKLHYAAIAYVSLLPTVLSRSIAYKRLQPAIGIGFAVIAPSLLIAASFLTMPHLAPASRQIAFSTLASPGSWLLEVREIYLAGVAHDTFWSSRDWIDTAFFPGPLLSPIRLALSISSVVVLAVVILSRLYILRRISHVATRRHRRYALTLLLGDGPILLYIGWTIALIVIDLSVPGRLGLLGRYWFPTLSALICTLMLGVVRPRWPRLRKRVARAVSLTWLAYAAFAAPFAFSQASHRFFSTPPKRSTLDRYVQVERIADSSGTAFVSENIDIARGDRLCVEGLAIDSRFGLPARGVALRIDNRDRSLRYGIQRPYPANIYLDDALRDIGFEGCVRTDDLRAGRHNARLIVFARDLTPLRWPPHLRIFVHDAVSSKRRTRRVRRARPISPTGLGPLQASLRRYVSVAAAR